MPNWSSRQVCIINTDTERYCTDVRKVEVKVGITPLPGTTATVYACSYIKTATYGNAYKETVNDWIVIYVRTEQQRKDYQAKIDRTIKTLYGARDVKIEETR